MPAKAGMTEGAGTIQRAPTEKPPLVRGTVGGLTWYSPLADHSSTTWRGCRRATARGRQKAT